MAFAGKYELVHQENFETFMKAIGLSDELIQKGKDVKSVTEIQQNGKHFIVTVTTGSKVLRNEFTIGEEAELETPTGEKVKSVVKLEGDNKLVVQLKAITSTTELSGDTITHVRLSTLLYYFYVCLNVSSNNTSYSDNKMKITNNDGDLRWPYT
ncbi:hypothetical protein XENTR_v10000250 [Xenopus tropicalis]|nr:hypothetical protein XENTR_v10000250 [Xenopus tropicalis]